MEEEISLKDMLEILKRRFIIILATMLLITIVGGSLSVLLNKQEYSSTTSLLVGEEKEIRVEPTEPMDEDSEFIYETTIVYGDTTISKQASRLYNEIIQRKDLLESVIDNLNLDMSVGQLRNTTTMEIPSDSGIIEVKVKGINLAKADEIVNELAKGFMQLVFDITETENIRIMNPGSKPVITNTQNIKLNTAISMVLGLMIGIFLAFIVEYLDDRIRTTNNVEKKLGLEVVGEIASSSVAIEALRTIRTNIQFSDRFRDKKTLVITSPSMEGKSGKISVDLSSIIAEGNNKVLLVDCNLRSPSLHEKYKLFNKRGFSDIIIGKSNLQDAINIHEKNNNLHILTAGNVEKNTWELLSGEGVKEFLATAKDKYDYIILNSYPIGEVSDSVALSALADGVILTLGLGTTRERDVKVAKKMLEKVGANIIGVLLS